MNINPERTLQAMEGTQQKDKDAGDYFIHYHYDFVIILLFHILGDTGLQI